MKVESFQIDILQYTGENFKEVQEFLSSNITVLGNEWFMFESNGAELVLYPGCYAIRNMKGKLGVLTESTGDELMALGIWLKS